jgi:hypothetical protein
LTNTIDVTDEMMEKVENVIDFSLECEKSTNRTLCQTGEIGELKACKMFELALCSNKIETGIDAIDKEGKKVQIKSRRLGEKKEEGGPPDTLGGFSKHEFDYALMVLLDKNYDVIEVWRADYNCIKDKFEEKKDEFEKKKEKKIERQEKLLKKEGRNN